MEPQAPDPAAERRLATAVVAVLALLAGVLLGATGSDASGTPWRTMALAALAACGVLGALVFALNRENRRLAERLRSDEARALALGELSDAGLWRSDAQHRLVELRAAPGAGPLRPGLVGRALWDALPAAGLQERVVRHEPLDGVPAGAPGPDAQAPVLLSGRPLRDRHGRFDGYVGMLRVAPAVQPVPAETRRPPRRRRLAPAASRSRSRSATRCRTTCGRRSASSKASRRS